MSTLTVALPYAVPVAQDTFVAGAWHLAMMEKQLIHMLRGVVRSRAAWMPSSLTRERRSTITGNGAKRVLSFLSSQDWLRMKH
mmetsp:Transcript_22712/g.69413  ORF Transcript_22712/g.69413 Transcript_22712/m.69413 type:complete len:83 (+) Transcript_22712:984-1232(+)